MNLKVFIPVLATLALFGCAGDPEKHFESALEYYQRKDFTISEGYIRKALALKPDHIPAYLLLGRIGVESGDEKSAEMNYRNAYDIARQRDYQLKEEDLRARESNIGLVWPEAAFYLADVEFRSKNYNRAIALYDEILEEDDSGIWRKRAFEAKSVTRDFSDYRKKFEILRQQNYASPDDPRIQAEMSLLLMEMANGLAQLGKIESVSEQVALSKQIREQAETALEKVYEASPEIQLPATEAVIAYCESQEALMRGKFDEALAAAEVASEKDPNSARYHFAVASILQIIDSKSEEIDHTDRIIAYAKRAIDIDPTVWRYLIFYAGRLREAGQLEDSYDYLQRARKNCTDEAVILEIDQTLGALESAMEAERQHLNP